MLQRWDLIHMLTELSLQRWERVHELFDWILHQWEELQLVTEIILQRWDMGLFPMRSIHLRSDNIMPDIPIVYLK